MAYLCHQERIEIIMSQRVALITGSAKRIGAATAQHLHDAGFNIVVHYNRSDIDALKLMQDLNEKRQDSCKLVQGDVSDVEALQQIASSAIDAFGRLDVLVNNASSFYPTPIGTITINDWQSLVGSNMQAPLFLSQFCHQELKKNQGVIINMVDIHAERPLKDHTLYCMAKAALVSMTKSLAQELAPHIRVNGVAPGAILWPETELSEQDKQQILESVPVGKCGAPEHIAQTIKFLIDNEYITGQIVAVDGGRSITSGAKA